MTRSALDVGGSSDHFRPDLEGLRACAVVLVLLYHASVPGFGGGYIGVDVFFVLSGFLITGLLMREIQRTGTVSLPDFYARRARRLLPASALVLLVTLIASIFLMPPIRMPDVSIDVASAALYVSNIGFAVRATDYLQADLSPSPILHFWSLGVEEQFYIFWPAIILLVTRRRGDLVRRIAIASAVTVVLSFGVSIWLTEANAPWAFFSLPSRAWELGIGAVLAVGATRLGRLAERPAAMMAWAGLAMVGASGMVLDGSTPFPGTAALLPTVGSALVIAGGFRQSPLAPGRWLSMAVPRFLGRISYSLYLWHWPLLVLPAAALDSRLPWWARGGLVLVAIVLAAATQRWVEDPLRHGRGIGTVTRRNLALAGALTLTVATVSLGIGISSASALPTTVTTDIDADERALREILAASGAPTDVGIPATQDRAVPNDLLPALADVAQDHPVPYVDGCHAKLEDAASGTCIYGDPNGRRTMILFGDSHALSWFPAIQRIAMASGWRLLDLTKAACQSVDFIPFNATLKRVYRECLTWRQAAFERIAEIRPDVVIVTNSKSLGGVVNEQGMALEGADKLQAWRAGMALTLGRLDDLAGQVVVIADTPVAATDPAACLSRNPDSILACSTPYERAVDQEWMSEERTAAAKGGASFVDPTPWVCPTTPCPPVLGNFLVMRDPGHLATYFAAAISDRLHTALRAVIVGL